MQQLKLVRPSIEYKHQYESMMEEWESFGGRLNPGALRRYSNKRQANVSYEEWLKWIEEDRNYGQDLYFLVDDNYVLGAISIRFKRTLETAGIDGHVGFGIRPSKRNKGYATMQIGLALEFCKSIGIKEVFISAKSTNIPSQRTIIKNGGVLQNVVNYEDYQLNRYYIYL